MARLLMSALGRAGHEVALASRLRTWDGAGDRARQARLAALGGRLAARLLRRYRVRPETRPEAWFTYHLYYKAPDWIGPPVSQTLGIPYLVAEASLAHKRAEGPWALGHQGTLAALARADALIALNPADVPALACLGAVEPLAPFLDPEHYRAAARDRAGARVRLARALGLDPEQPWLLSVAMMRAGDKLASYRLLAEATRACAGDLWQLLIVGDGPARAKVEQAFNWAETGRVRFLGARTETELPELYAVCDLLVWPAHTVAYGMAILEAQAAGLPVLAGASGGVPTIVRDGETGVLAPPGDAAAFAAALRGLLGAPEQRRAMALAARAEFDARHGLDQAAARLDAILLRAAARRCAGGP